MPVIVLIGNAERFIPEIQLFFKDKFDTKIMQEAFKHTRSTMAALDENKLYVVPNLTKPERYEIFCLARKNGQQFITIADPKSNDSTVSDKNLILIDQFDGEKIYKKLLNSRIVPTTVNKRSKGISLKSVSELKGLINRINREYEQFGNANLIFKECEDKIVKMWNFNNTQSTVEEAEECYRKMIENELRKNNIKK
ncbi:uncharacterized protein VICG_00348 [Vittaforma corneae ATCC 50505]|uniref:Uncharacterized protein n=1 Tax=Vittaforma corneae (strain ATCC 50505) TaxID=993615 RepID=L2GP52_VITCO|nr:uncharacterized protein VICG_00348 [Vittaforma corneae ATCC 50505]ELA42596.1 hypothetical protein VICG_00348 [Vittaforma corneae ATCC 50505]